MSHTSPNPRPTSSAQPGAGAGRDPLPDYQPEDFFFLRSPLLPMDDFARLFAGGAAAGDLELAGERLLRLAAEPEIAEALFVASPELIAGLERAALERAAPGGTAKKNDRLRQSLCRYLLRLMTRPTPFGLFAGGSLGNLGERTELSLAGRAEYRRHTRLDMDFLDRLTRDLENDPALRGELTYRPNNSLYRAAGRWRYAEGRLVGEARAYHLVVAKADVFIDAALAAAAGGARLAAIARAVAGADPEAEIDGEEAEAFVHELIDAQLLVSDLGPRVTGPLPIDVLVERLAAIPAAAPQAACLAEVRERLAALDRQPLGSPAELYRGLGRQLELLGSKVVLPRLFQVDMTKKAAALALGPQVVDEVKRAIGFLRRLRGGPPVDLFSAFRTDFLRRYEPGRQVPLALVLDEEVGIGFQRSAAAGTEYAPLLEGIAFPGQYAEQQVSWSLAQDLVVRKTFEAARRGEAEVSFSDADLAPLEALPKGVPGAEPARLYSAFQAIFALAAESPAAIDRGDFKLLFRGATGASGGTLLGRFCHADPQLAASLGRHLRHEERHHPDAVFAEIVHLPEGRIGNILLRPLLRPYEIPFLGRGGADDEHQLPITDLLVTVVGDQVILTSQRLGRRVIPRLSSAHNYSLRGLGIYKFLSALQHQGTCGGLSWMWGPLESLPYLPRVVYGRTILAPARWRVEKSELAALNVDGGKEEGGRVPTAGLAAWRRQRQLPRRVLLADADNELFVDFENPLTVEAFFSIVRNRPAMVLLECLQEESELVLSGPEGRFTHEIVLPFVRRPELAPPPADASAPAPSRLAPSRPVAHPPGSGWVYAKLYTGTAAADGVLEETAGELARRFGKAIDRFFFLRFADPDFHLRLRFEVLDEHLRRELAWQLAAIAGELLRQGKIWDLRFETYRPEVERYGGAAAMACCERIFDADSRAALALLPHLRGDDAAEARWLAALCSVDALLAGLLGEDPAARLSCLEGMARGFATEFRFDKASRQGINRRQREKKDALDAALGRRAPAGSPLGLALACLDQRGREIAEPAAELRRLEAAGSLETSLFSLAGSLAHMTVNRLVAAEPRAHEAVIYELLHRQLLSRQARRPQPARQLAEVG
jgi:thiopeptide-type bacteriocin biosynthesis protein